MERNLQRLALEALRIDQEFPQRLSKQQSGTGVHVYFPPNGVRKPEPENIFGIDPRSLILEEGEFKCLARHEVGLPAIGLPSFSVYTKDDNGQPQLLMDLRIAMQKWEPLIVYFVAFSRYRLPKPLADGQKYHRQE